MLTLDNTRKYRFIHTPKPELVYRGKWQGWHQFARATDPTRIWSEVTDDELNLIEEVPSND